MKLILLTGMLASGKSIALRVFQDLGYYCIDNMPPDLIVEFVELSQKIEPKIEKIALVVDVRGRMFFGDIDELLDSLKKNYGCEIVFINAMDEVLIRRYKASRRRHLLGADERIEVTIQKERKLLQKVWEKSDYFIDTTNSRDAEFKSKLIKMFGTEEDQNEMNIDIVSFGFKYGILMDADLIFDVRFLPNPYYEPELKALSGKDDAVYQYVMSYPESNEFVRKVVDMLSFLLPKYLKEGKRQLIIGIGCTGGRHRSVTITRVLQEQLRKNNIASNIDHRDIGNDIKI